MATVSGTFADVVELKTGQRIEGTFKGADDASVRIEVGGQVVTFTPEQVRAIYYGSSPAHAPANADPGARSRRYVLASPSGRGYALWTNLVSFNACAKALIRGTAQDVRIFCEEGFSGIKPKVGSLDAGAEVEILDSRACGNEMVHVRVSSEPLKGQTGCITSTASTTVKPEPK